MFDYNEKYSNYLSAFDQQLNSAINNLVGVPQLLKDAMVYAVVDGGKRVRPVLCFAVADMLGVNFSEVKEFALALECIHSYSLVHDDLPSMDNDDYRRGKLSTHKKFGEAYGILAGDALLNFAFEHCLSKPNFDNKCAKALSVLANCAGANGMIKGQVLDLYNEKSIVLDEKTLYDIYENKTAKLLTAPLLISSIFADNKFYNELNDFGYHLGVMFQITDDIMDIEGTLELIGKTPNKDEQSEKLTSVKLFGIDGAKKRCEYHYNCCMKVLKTVDNSEFLAAFTDKIYNRKK